MSFVKSRKVSPKKWQGEVLKKENLATVVQLELESASLTSLMMSLNVPLSPSNTLMMSPSSRASTPSSPFHSQAAAPSFGASSRVHQQRWWRTYDAEDGSPPTISSPSPSHAGTSVGGTSTHQYFAPSTPRTTASTPTPARSASARSAGAMSDTPTRITSPTTGGGYHRGAIIGCDDGFEDVADTPSRSRSRLRGREGVYSPNTVLRAGGFYDRPKGGHPNRIRDGALSGGQLREDSFDHVNTRSRRGNIDWIAGASNPPVAAQMIKPFAGYRVGRSAPPDPYNVQGTNLWRDRTRAHTWVPIGPAGTIHDSLRVDWVRSEPASVQAAAYPRSRSPGKKHPDRCSSPDKMHPAVLAPNTKRRSVSIAHATMRDMQSLLRKSEMGSHRRDALRGGGAPRTQSPTFRGRITVRLQDVTMR